MLSTAVVTPTVPDRRATRGATLDQWRALGHDPILVEQAPPYSHDRQLETARTAIQAGLDTGAEIIVYAEDDIDLDPRLLRILPAAAGPAPCSLWHRPRFRPAHPPLGPDQILIAPARSTRTWIGSLCLVLSRTAAEAVLDARPDRGGIDNAARLVPGLRITIPSLVAHRPLPRIASRGGHIDCDDYTGPRTPETPC